MGPHHLIRPWESRQFRRCRRAWDLGARERQDLEPAEPTGFFDFEEAIRDALHIYYFPGMWAWDRGIVRPLTIEAFRKSMNRQRAAYAQRREPTEAQDQQWELYLALGTDLLWRYFGWAPEIDTFTPVQVATMFDVTVPDPRQPQTGLIAPDGRGIHYRVRIDMAVIDQQDLYWHVEHRLVDSAWTELDELLLDEPSLTRSWAWEQEFLAKVEGTIHTELRTGAPDMASDGTDMQALDIPSGFVTQYRGAYFRQTRIPRSRAELAGRGAEIAHEIRDMVDPGLRLYPNPAPQHCRPCEFREPCVALTQGVDEQPIVAASFRKRTAEDYEPGRLGSTWGFVPAVHRVAEHRAPRREG